GYVYNLNHALDLGDDGNFNITERGNIKGYLTFGQAQQGLSILTGGSYGRCNAFFSTYHSMVNDPTTYPLVSLPTKISQNFNKPALAADYEVAYTNNPNFQSNGITEEETIELSADEKNLVDIKHRFNLSYGKRAPLVGGIFSIMNADYASSPAY